MTAATLSSAQCCRLQDSNAMQCNAIPGSQLQNASCKTCWTVFCYRLNGRVSKRQSTTFIAARQPLCRCFLMAASANNRPSNQSCAPAAAAVLRDAAVLRRVPHGAEQLVVALFGLLRLIHSFLALAGGLARARCTCSATALDSNPSVASTGWTDRTSATKLVASSLSDALSAFGMLRRACVRLHKLSQRGTSGSADPL